MAYENSDSYAIYMEFAKRIADFGFLSTTFFCLSLIYLTVFEVKRNFGSYKYLLVTFPTLGILFATLEVVIYPYSTSHNCGYMFFCDAHPFGLGENIMTWLLAGYGGIYALTICNLATQFLYRYWAVFKETQLRLFKGFKLLIWVSYSLSFGIVWAVGIYYFNKLDAYSVNFFKEEVLKRYNLDFSEISGMAMVAYGSDKLPRWRNIGSIINMTVIMLIQYAIIIYCAVRMYKEMEEKVQILSPSLRKLHSQFFKTLILQIVIPTVILFSPVLFIIFLPLLDLEVDLPSGVFFSSFTVFPGMDSFLLMYIVQDYRKAIINLKKKLLDKIDVWTTRPGNEVTQTGVTNARNVVI